MAKITGIGGVFVKARDPDKLRAFYRDVLGLALDSWGGAQLWNDGPRNYGIWAAFAADDPHFAPSDKPFMINLRVDDLDGLLAQIRARAPSCVLDRREDTPDGRFAYVVDPEGTLLELFEPADLL